MQIDPNPFVSVAQARQKNKGCEFATPEQFHTFYDALTINSSLFSRLFRMIIVQGHFRVCPEKFALYRRRVADHAALVAVLDGCLQYSISEDPGEPGLLWVGERWRDKAAQAAHMAGDHMAVFNGFMKHLTLKSADIAAYTCDSEGQWMMRAG